MLHEGKTEGLYYDEDNKPRSTWYDETIRKKKMTPSAVARELDISFEGSVEGIIFKEFSHRLHVYKGNIGINPHRPVIRYFDYGACCAVIFSQKDEYNRIKFFHEIVIETDGNANKLAAAANAYSLTLKCNGFEDYDDPAGSHDGWVTGTPSVQIMNEHKIYPSHSISAATQARRTARIEMMHQKLNELVDGQPVILVHDSLKLLIDAFEGGYHHPMNTDGTINIDDVDEIHPYEDVMDCAAGTLLETMTIQKTKLPLRQQRTFNPYTGR